MQKVSVMRVACMRETLVWLYYSRHEHMSVGFFKDLNGFSTGNVLKPHNFQALAPTEALFYNPLRHLTSYTIMLIFC